MGTDIHSVWQKKTSDGWADVSSTYEENRHYQLFAVLANVRNGFGFAGVPTGDAVWPIAEPRGLPSDFTMVGEDHPLNEDTASKWEKECLAKYPEECPNGLCRWMGDHSHSWLSGDEMLAWKAPTITKCGVLSRDEYAAWDKIGRPASYCGGVSGRDVVVVDESVREQVPGWTHVSVSWTSALDYELAYFFDEVRRLKEEHGEIRFVFGFDS